MAGRLLAFLLLLLPFALGRGIAEVPHATRKEVHLYQVYIAGTELFDAAGPVGYMITSPADEQAVLSEMSRLAQSYGQCTAKKGDEDLDRTIAKFLIPRMWEYDAEGGDEPEPKEFRQYYETRKGEFPTREWFRGARILVEDGPEQKAEAEKVQEMLKEKDADFREVAKKYYRTVGEEKDGTLGRIERGQIRDSLFDIFASGDPAQPYFGPVREEHGLLFGKVYAKGEAGFLPVEEVRERILGDFIRNRVKTRESELLADGGSRFRIERMEFKNKETAPPADAVAYTFEGAPRTYSDVMKALRGTFGDVKSWAFFEAAREKAIRNEVLMHSEAAADIRKTETYCRVFAALAAYSRVAEGMKADIAAIPNNEEAFRRYYEEKKDTQYRETDQVQIIIVRAVKNPNGVTEPAERHAAARDAWEKISRIYAEFSAEPAGFSFEKYKDDTGLRFLNSRDWLPIDSLGREVGTLLANSPEMRRSDLIISPLEYTFFYVIDRRRPLYPPYERISGRVKSDYLSDRTREIRERHLGASHAATPPSQ